MLLIWVHSDYGVSCLTIHFLFCKNLANCDFICLYPIITNNTTNVSRSAEKENPSKNKGLKFVISNTSKTASAIIANPIYLVIG